MKEITVENPYTQKYDLDNCDVEPIYQIQTVQSFASLLIIDIDTWVVRQTSTNISSYLPFSVEEVLEKPLTELLPKSVVDLLKKGVEFKNFTDINPIVLNLDSQETHNHILASHIIDNQLVIEVEKESDIEESLIFLNKIDRALQSVQSASYTSNLFNLIAEEVKFITKYDRVMVYQFDEEYNGEVIAESKEPELEPFLNICYPATDIPKQARALFLSNRLRMLVDVNDELSFITPPLHPDTKQPLYVGECASRGVSPIHLEYLRNMKVRATLNVAIVTDNKLWGLISCHHYNGAKLLDYRTRNLIRFFAQILSGHLSLSRIAELQFYALQNNDIRAKLFKQINLQKDVIAGLLKGKLTVLDYVPAIGAAVILENSMEIIGETPPKKQIQDLVKQLDKNTEEELVFYTNNAGRDLPDWEVDTNAFAGVLSVQISRNFSEYLIWFRRPLEKEVVWGGNPEKSIVKSEKHARLSPRKSFDKWKQVIKGQARPWSESERTCVLALRNDIKEVILNRFNELKQLNEELKQSYKEMESFSYTVSHDLRSPLRTIEGFSQLLLEDFSDKISEVGIDMLNTVIRAVNQMNEFIDDILDLSKLSKTTLKKKNVDIANILHGELANLKQYSVYSPKTVFNISDNLPNIYGDPTMIRQLFLNLISNAVKYSKNEEDPLIEISGTVVGNQVIYKIKDNGIGIDNRYISNIFDVFSRLVDEEEFEGTGIGLAIVKRIVDRHNGDVTVESELGKGTTFTVFFPLKNKEN